MAKLTKYCREKWYIVLVGLLLAMQAGVFLICGENSYIAVHDNLDLFVCHFKMLDIYDAFFAHNVDLPMLGGISRDNFASQFSLYNAFYMFLPDFWAYMAGYFCKIGIGIFGFLLLAKDVCKDSYVEYRPVLWIVALAFGLIPVFPAYGIAFTSVPILIWLLRRIYKKPTIWLFLGVFTYPLLSYFSYFGFFLLAYLVCAVFILWIRDKKFPGWIFVSLIVLALGYVCFEYRLFIEMLFSDTETIRATMVGSDWSFAEIINNIMLVFTQTIFHAQDSHMYVVLPVCILGLAVINFNYMRKKDFAAMKKDGCNLVFFLIVFNCLVYGIYGWKAFRQLFETLIPQLEGFQFNRTIFFNPFLWYALFFLVLRKLYMAGKGMWKGIANTVAVLAVLVVMFAPQVYNDFYYTCYNKAYEVLKGKEPSMVNYREFYSAELFEEIKEEIGYNNEWAVAYGMHPAILSYNGIATLDGYLGFYSVEYKEAFRKAIAPALDMAPEFASYFDTWGARAYIYAGTGENSYEPKRNLTLSDNRLWVDTQALRDLDCGYIFSRIAIENTAELEIFEIGSFSHENSPYTIYVYSLSENVMNLPAD